MSEQQHTFQTADGSELFYRHCAPKTSTNEKKAIILFHRGHEHSDARGHGNSPGERGDSPSIATSIADVDDFVRHIVTTYDIAIENIAIIAQSVSSVLVSAWIHDYAPRIRCAVLVAPAFSVKIYVPFARRGLQLMYKLRGNFFVNSYVKAQYLTHDEARIESYNNDELIARAISVRVLLGLYDAGERVVNDAPTITTPIQLFIAGDDKIVNTQAQHDFYNRLGSHTKQRHVLPDCYHDILGEKDHDKTLANTKNFIDARFAEDFQIIDATNAHRHGYTKQEADELATPLAKFSPRNMYWAFTGLAQKTLVCYY